MEREGMEESDQLPEEAPEEVAGDETSSDDAREEVKDSPGAADESDPDQATGHPGNGG